MKYSRNILPSIIGSSAENNILVGVAWIMDKQGKVNTIIFLYLGNGINPAYITHTLPPFTRFIHSLSLIHLSFRSPYSVTAFTFALVLTVGPAVGHGNYAVPLALGVPQRDPFPGK